MNASSPIPARSWLFRIDLHGRGTGQVESLAGYVARLAAAHFITPSTLLHRGLEWWDAGQPENVGQWKRRTAHLKLRSSINGHISAQRWISLLEQHTTVRDLAEATTIPWAHLFPARGLLRQHHAWCPDCYTEEDNPYDRLLWELAPVRVCPKHKVRLVEHCPSCSSHVPPIHARSVPGACPRCEAHLAQCGHAAADPVDEYDLWVAGAMSDFLKEVSSRPASVPANRVSVAKTLSTCMQLAGLGDAGALARKLNVSRITAWHWATGKGNPDLGNTLRICYAFNLPLLGFLTGEIPPNLAGQGSDVTRPRPIRRSPHCFDPPVVIQKIESLVNAHADGPLSFEEVSRQVGFAPRILRNHLPALSRQIGQRYRQRCRDKIAARREKLKQDIRIALKTCRKEKLYPSRSDVAGQLPKPGVFRSAEARQILKQLELEL